MQDDELHASPLTAVGNQTHAPEVRKMLGAYYTSAEVARFLTGWAIRSRDDLVIDPSCGGGVFLEAAAEKLRAIGGIPWNSVYGVEYDDDTLMAFSQRPVATELDPRHLLNRSFFEVDPFALGPFDAVVGNPPFIRYQHFRGESRRLALERALAAGVRLSGRASSWAPFVVHSVSALRRGGRLAMVSAGELMHARYAIPVLEHLVRSFERLVILTFQHRLFPHLSADAVLVLADGKGVPHRDFKLHDLRDSSDLGDPHVLARRAVSLDPRAVERGETRLTENWLPQKARKKYRNLRIGPGVAALGDLCEVHIGYVTGANEFFHLNRAEVAEFDIPEVYLRRLVGRGADLLGLTFTERDWRDGSAAGRKNQLLTISEDEFIVRLPAGLRRYVERGRRRLIHKRRKCRSRPKWYSVPHVFRPDLFLTSMSDLGPKLVANRARVVSPNTLHAVRIREEASMTPLALAVAWHTSLTMLSCEIEGHSLGGSMLKLEPSEARRVLIALPPDGAAVRSAARRIDRKLRARNLEDALDIGDEIVLRGSLGLDARTCSDLREAYRRLSKRRRRKTRAAGTRSRVLKSRGGN